MSWLLLFCEGRAQTGGRGGGSGWPGVEPGGESSHGGNEGHAGKHQVSRAAQGGWPLQRWWGVGLRDEGDRFIFGYMRARKINGIHVIILRQIMILNLSNTDKACVLFSSGYGRKCSVLYLFDVFCEHCSWIRHIQPDLMNHPWSNTNIYYS